jgi:hypothetical protein
MKAGGELGQLHEILTVVADVYAVRIDGALASSNRPLQVIGGSGRSEAEAITDSRLDLGALLVIIPSDKLKVGQWLRSIVETVDCGERLQPGLAALL